MKSKKDSNRLQQDLKTRSIKTKPETMHYIKALQKYLDAAQISRETFHSTLNGYTIKRVKHQNIKRGNENVS